MFLPLQYQDMNLVNFRKSHYYYHFANSLSFLHNNICKLRHYIVYTQWSMCVYVCACIFL